VPQGGSRSVLGRLIERLGGAAAWYEALHRDGDGADGDEDDSERDVS
jgi:hypothetical protein